MNPFSKVIAGIVSSWGIGSSGLVLRNISFGVTLYSIANHYTQILLNRSPAQFCRGMARHARIFSF
jgi:hypothetical protein